MMQPDGKKEGIVAKIAYRRLLAEDVDLMREALALFGRAFGGHGDYSSPPSRAYLQGFLAKPGHYVGVAYASGRVVGAITAYEIEKYERARTEIFIYDLAVDADFRRRGLATALINHCRDWGETRGAWVAVIMADDGEPAPFAVYSRLGRHEIAHVFDMPIPRQSQ